MPGPLNPWRVIIGTHTFTATEETLAVAHGLPAAPTFVLVSQANGGVVDWSATATTLTFSQQTAAAQAISYIAGVE